MKVRAWVMIGGPEASRDLPPAATVGVSVQGRLPNAAEFQPGVWILWTPSLGHDPVALVCVEIPL